MMDSFIRVMDSIRAEEAVKETTKAYVTAALNQAPSNRPPVTERCAAEAGAQTGSDGGTGHGGLSAAGRRRICRLHDAGELCECRHQSQR
jgi:hypothetical protein